MSNDCDSAAQAPLPVPVAVARLLAAARPVTDVEGVPLDQAAGRVLAAPLISPLDQPAWDSSAMDGWALRLADLPADGGWLPVSARITAGSEPAPLAPGTAARIFTGAPVPPGADTVVVQEVCQVDRDQVRLPAGLRPGANIRRRGEDIASGSRLLEAGTRLGPTHLALAASVGTATLSVYRRPRVAVFATGDELVEPGQPLAPGQIYNSNRRLFAGLLTALGCQVLDLGHCPDRLDATIDLLRQAADGADLVLASGGVSVGEEDHVRAAVAAVGRLTLWQVAMRPGKPLAVGHLVGPAGETPFIGSPGNPVSLFVALALFVRPFVQTLAGMAPVTPPRSLRVRAAFDWPKPDKREEYHRARLAPGADGWPEVTVFPSRSSAAINSLTWANGLVVVPAGQAVHPGDPVEFIPFCGLFEGRI